MHSVDYLKDILILLTVSVFIIIIFKHLRISPVLGYLLSGALIGSNGFHLISYSETTSSIAELGIVFMLFAIGLELTLEKLLNMRKYVLGFGSLQVVVTGVVLSIITYLFGNNKEISIIIGVTLALSSTAIVLQVIEENAEKSTRVGRLSLSILLLQDLAVIPILVLLPAVADPNVEIFSAIGSAFVNATVALLIIFSVGKLLLKPIFKVIVSLKSNVLFFSMALIIILGSAFISHYLNLSLALGAFVAGLMLAETEYKYRIEHEIESIKSILLGLFFITIGMTFKLEMLMDNLLLIIVLSISLIAIKAGVIISLCKLFRFPLAPAIHSGLLLSQGGEFAFVVFIMAVENGVMENQLSQILMTSVTVTMAFTPLLASFGRNIKKQIYIKNSLKDNKIRRELGDIEKHIIIIGFSKIGRVVADVMREKNIPYLILSTNHRLVRIEKSNGYHIYYGDPLNLEILKRININSAESAIITNDDEILCFKITNFIRENFSDLHIVTKSENISGIERFKKVGANLVVSKNFETGLQISREILTSIGLEDSVVEEKLLNKRSSF
ncbi:cation:proton antiporter [Flavobacteriaceae bacterium]|nr:cation:proton antiporter [Flavobacteriaceae bacterium]